MLGMHGRERQNCDHLQTRGPTLMIGPDDDLEDIIRREYKRMMRAAKQRAAA